MGNILIGNGRTTCRDVLRRTVRCAILATWLVGSLPALAEPQTIESVVLYPLVEADAPMQKAGVLARIAVAEGDVVKKGQLLAALDDRVAALALRQAKTLRDQAQARVENEVSIEFADKALQVARAELARSEESIAEFAGSISQSQLDVERLTVEKLQLERRQAEHELILQRYELAAQEHAVAAAELELHLHELRASFGGTIVVIHGRLGEWLEPGRPVLRLVATERLRAEGFADGRLLGPAHVGQAVEFKLDSGDGRQRATGTLRFVSPEVDPVTNQVRVWAEIDNHSGALRPGERGLLQVADELKRPRVPTANQ